MSRVLFDSALGIGGGCWLLTAIVRFSPQIPTEWQTIILVGVGVLLHPCFVYWRMVASFGDIDSPRSIS